LSSWAALFDGTEVGVLVERVADAKSRQATLQPLDDGVRDRLLH